jgi:Co/Zn/Cd efflux system component
MKSTRLGTILGTAVVWVSVGIFWYFATRSFHPTRRVALTVTISLVAAYAAAVYLNHLYLIPRFWKRGSWPAYWSTLLATMIAFTAVALTIIRVSYIRLLGPDPNPNGLYIHFGIDFLGMVAHVLMAAVLVWAWQHLWRRNIT